MSELLDTEYWRMHESAAHVKLRALLPPEPVEEFAELDEFVMDFLLPEIRLVICILDHTHDHTDSYHIEKKMKDAAEAARLKILFLEEDLIFNDPVRAEQLIEKHTKEK